MKQPPDLPGVDLLVIIVSIRGQSWIATMSVIYSRNC